jgi:hypothetical protein
MNLKAEKVKNDIISQLKQDGIISTGFVSIVAGNTTNNVLESVTIELTVYKYFETEIKVFLDDEKQVIIQYKNINGVIGSDDMIKLSTTLNKSKPSLAGHFN